MSPISRQVPGGGVQAPACPAYPPDELVAAEQVDEAVIGELGDERVGDPAQGLLQLQRAGQPLADPLEQAVAVLVALVAAQRLPAEDDQALDAAGGVTQGHGVRPGVDGAAVGPDVAEGPLPHRAAQDAPAQLLGLLMVLLGDAEGQPRPADVLRATEPEEGLGEGVGIDDVAVPVADDDRHLHGVQHGLRRQ
ncbi:hypothetical protein GCM10029978_106660 [Actinoallomurus acanthiterrae]